MSSFPRAKIRAGRRGAGFAGMNNCRVRAGFLGVELDVVRRVVLRPQTGVSSTPGKEPALREGAEDLGLEAEHRLLSVPRLEAGGLGEAGGADEGGRCLRSGAGGIAVEHRDWAALAGSILSRETA
jgi:hypothetical protein